MKLPGQLNCMRKCLRPLSYKHFRTRTINLKWTRGQSILVMEMCVNLPSAYCLQDALNAWSLFVNCSSAEFWCLRRRRLQWLDETTSEGLGNNNHCPVCGTHLFCGKAVHANGRSIIADHAWTTTYATAPDCHKKATLRRVADGGMGCMLGQEVPRGVIRR